MKHIILMVAAGMLLAGCQTWSGMHDSIKMQAIAANFSAQTGVTAGYLGATIDRAPVVDKDGKPLQTAGVCARSAGANTFANMNSKANASANTVPQAAGPIQAPSLAVATGDTTANAGGAIIAAAALTGNPADTIAAYCNNSALPSAVPGSIVRDGVAPR